MPLIPAAMKLADEILAGPSFEETPEGVLAEEARIVANAKKMFLQAAGGALQKYREKLADEQELVAALANIVMEIYAMESCLLRAQKAAASQGRNRCGSAMIDAARVFIADAAERVDHEAKRAVAAVHEGDMLTTQMAVLKRFGKRPVVDTIGSSPPCSRRCPSPRIAIPSKDARKLSQAADQPACFQNGTRRFPRHTQQNPCSNSI